jgi:hypothetical protein
MHSSTADSTGPGRCSAPTYISKADGSKRPRGLPTLYASDSALPRCPQHSLPDGSLRLTRTGLSPRWIVSAFLVHLWRTLDSVGSKLGVYLSSGAGKLLANLGQDDTQLADLGTD